MKTALIVIDMQMIMQERIDSGRQHVNSDAPDNVAALLAAFRRAERLVVHVRHEDRDPASPLHADASGYPTMPCAQNDVNELVFVKSSSSAFVTTKLEEFLRSEAVSHLYLAGAVAGFCVSSTARSAADLGFDVSIVRDAVIGFDLPSANLDARTIFDVTMGLLESGFAEMVDTASIVGAS